MSEQLVPSSGGVRAWLDGIEGLLAPKSLVYYRGDLAFDRGHFVTRAKEETVQLVWLPCGPVDVVAKLTWEAYERGDVLLCQKRLGPRDYLYIAIRTKAWFRKRRSM